MAGPQGSTSLHFLALAAEHQKAHLPRVHGHPRPEAHQAPLKVGLKSLLKDWLYSMSSLKRAVRPPSTQSPVKIAST